MIFPQNRQFVTVVTNDALPPMLLMAALDLYPKNVQLKTFSCRFDVLMPIRPAVIKQLVTDDVSATFCPVMIIDCSPPKNEHFVIVAFIAVDVGDDRVSIATKGGDDT